MLRFGFKLLITTVLFGGGALLGMSAAQAQMSHQGKAAKSVYQANCQSCHGVDGSGVNGIVNLRSSEAVARLSRADMLQAATTGHDPAVSAQWSSFLKGAKMEAVIEYIRESFMLPVDVADASRGRRIYAASCSVCHGERGDGASWTTNSLNPPPRNFLSEASKFLTREMMIRAVTDGNEGTAMTPFSTQLTPDDVAAVVDYIRGNFMGLEIESSERRKVSWANTPLPDGLKGDAEKGRDLFMRTCIECHGSTGEGDGRRAYFITPKPANFTSDVMKNKLNREILFNVTRDGVPGKEMPAWGKVMDDQSIADIVEYVFTQIMHPTDQDQKKTAP